MKNIAVIMKKDQSSETYENLEATFVISAWSCFGWLSFELMKNILCSCVNVFFFFGYNLCFCFYLLKFFF